MSSEEKEIHPTPEEIAAFQRWKREREGRQKEPMFFLKVILQELNDVLDSLEELVTRLGDEVDYLVSEEEARREAEEEEEGED